MRRNAEDFADEELDLLYISKRLREALKIEALLTEAGLDYLVETGTYVGGLLFRRELAGAFFYVAPAELNRAREVMTRNRYKPYEPE